MYCASEYNDQHINNLWYSFTKVLEQNMHQNVIVIPNMHYFVSKLTILYDRNMIELDLPFHL